jgi:hypothetical protein
MQHCRTNYGKALLLSVMLHVAVVGSAIAFAQYGGTLFSRDFRSITVSLVGNTDPGRPGSVPQAQKKKVVSVPVPEAPNQEVKSDLPEEDDLSHQFPAGGGDRRRNGRRGTTVATRADGRQTGDISHGSLLTSA